MMGTKIGIILVTGRESRCLGSDSFLYPGLRSWYNWRPDHREDYPRHCKEEGKNLTEKADFSQQFSFRCLKFSPIIIKRSILSVTRAVSAEYRPVNPQDMYDFFLFLEKAQLVKLKTSGIK